MTKKWWKEGVVYQIYPWSFMDSNGDGIGDIPGIIEKLDYIRDLGVDIVWLNPVYSSPNADMGYDISDYFNIMDEFGTLGDWDRLLEGLHRRGLRLVMDLVVNHTSDEHPWFIESRSGRDNPYRDYYIWRPGRDGREPNNWESFFSGSVWDFDKKTGEYYLHLFDRKQPDLNWENPKVRDEVWAMMRWWFDRGIDGFRMDTINMLSKVPGLPSVPVESEEPEGLHGPTPRKYLPGLKYFMNGPRIHEYLREMQDLAVKDYDVMTVGETPMVGPEQAAEYTGGENPEMSMLFQFEHMMIDHDPDGDRMSGRVWTLPELKDIVSAWQTTLHRRGWNSNYLTNHDQPRAVSRFGNDGPYRIESAKLLAAFTLSLEGTPYIYQGEEIGMTNVHFESIDMYRDVATLNHYRFAREEGIPDEVLLGRYHRFSRDNARTPMQWNGSSHGGFTFGTPWISVNPNYSGINVEADLAREDSIIRFYREMIRLRKSSDTLLYGGFRLLDRDNPDVFSYLRTAEELSIDAENDGQEKTARDVQSAQVAGPDRSAGPVHAADSPGTVKPARGEADYLVLLNFSDRHTSTGLGGAGVPEGYGFDPGTEVNWTCVIGNYQDSLRQAAGAELRPWEARIYRRDS